MLFFNDATIKALERELKLLKDNISDLDRRKGSSIARNSIKSSDNEKRIKELAENLRNITVFSASVYLYLKSIKGFDEEKFMKILNETSKNLKQKKRIVKNV